MERDKAIEIIHKEGLINFKMFEKRNNKENEVVLLKQYNGSVVKTKIKDFYNEPICMVVGG